MSLGGGSSKQSQSSNQSSQSSGFSQQYGSGVYGAQSPFLQDLYARAGYTAGEESANANSTGYLRTAGSFLSGAQDSLNQSNTALAEMLTPQDDPMLARYATNLGQQFNEQFLPGLQGEAALAGGLGGSRQQIGSALGAQRAMQTLGDFTAQTYSDQQNRRLAAAQGIGGNAQGYLDAGALSGNLAEFARSMPWYNLSQFQGLLGAPTTLDLGGYSQQQATSTGSSTGSGSSWNLKGGIGGG